MSEVSMDTAKSAYYKRKSQAQGAAAQGSMDFAKKQMAKARKTKAYIDKRESVEEAVDLEMHKKAAADHAAKAKPVGNKWPKGADKHDNAAKAHQHVIDMHKKFGPDHSGTKDAVVVAKNASNRAAGDSYKTALKKSGMKESQRPIFDRIMEKAGNRADHVKGATPPEPMDSKASGMEKDFVAKHGGLDGNDSGIDGAKAAADTAKAAAAQVKAAPARSGDNKNGDTKPIKSTEA